MTFRNYLALSFDKDFDSLFFVDNEFWVSKVHIMNNKIFKNEDYPNPKSTSRQFHQENKKLLLPGAGIASVLIGVFVIVIITTI